MAIFPTVVILTCDPRIVSRLAPWISHFFLLSSASLVRPRRFVPASIAHLVVFDGGWYLVFFHALVPGIPRVRRIPSDRPKVSSATAIPRPSLPSIASQARRRRPCPFHPAADLPSPWKSHVFRPTVASLSLPLSFFFFRAHLQVARATSTHPSMAAAAAATSSTVATPPRRPATCGTTPRRKARADETKDAEGVGGEDVKTRRAKKRSRSVERCVDVHARLRTRATGEAGERRGRVESTGKGTGVGHDGGARSPRRRAPCTCAIARDENGKPTIGGGSWVRSFSRRFRTLAKAVGSNECTCSTPMEFDDDEDGAPIERTRGSTRGSQWRGSLDQGSSSGPSLRCALVQKQHDRGSVIGLPRGCLPRLSCEGDHGSKACASLVSLDASHLLGRSEPPRCFDANSLPAARRTFFWAIVGCPKRRTRSLDHQVAR